MARLQIKNESGGGWRAVLQSNLEGPKKYSKPLELDLGGSRDLNQKDVARLPMKKMKFEGVPNHFLKSRLLKKSAFLRTSH